MNIKTITTTAGMNTVVLGNSANIYYWVKNIGTTNITAGATDNTENHAVIKPDNAVRVDTMYNTVYINGAGTVEIYETDISECPFMDNWEGGGVSLSGETSYTISNAVDYPLMGLNLYGKSTQDGMPSPETPVDIVSVGDSGSVTITADNGDSISTAATITSALPLCGIPVDSGGNYTDSNGQQWVCDELIYNADGCRKIIKRCEKTKLTSKKIKSMTEYPSLGNYFVTNIVADAASSLKPISNSFVGVSLGYANNAENRNYFRCFIMNTGDIILRNSVTENDKFPTLESMRNFVDSNDVYIVYPLAEPQEIELTAAEVGALKVLQTFDGATNIYNNGDAEMSVKYCTNNAFSDCVLPLVSGLQKQIDELQAAILSLGSNV